MKKTKLFLSILLLLTLTALAFKIVEQSKIAQTLKSDSAEINHFKYGLFNVDAWKNQLSIILAEEIDKLYLSRKNEKTLKSHLEGQLEVLIDKINERLKKKNNETANGRFKQSLMDSFVDVKDIKEGIPEYAAAILAEMSSKKTETQIKGMLKERINKYINETYDTRPLTIKERIIRRLNVSSEEEAKLLLTKKISRSHDMISELSLIFVSIAVIIFLLEGFNQDSLPKLQYAILTLTILILLFVGVTTPMIDMEAKISQFNFVLFDHPIQFQNQILYFQSKSVLDVFQVMIFHKDIPMKLVGILIVTFSVFFPAIKTISSFLFYFNFRQARENSVIKFFVLKSGKWSMADVLVVAIFMAYIGFNGIIGSQLDQIGSYSSNVDLMTTNGTNLQPGFYIFFSYTILAMFLSGIIKARPFKS